MAIEEVEIKQLKNQPTFRDDLEIRIAALEEQAKENSQDAAMNGTSLLLKGMAGLWLINRTYEVATSKPIDLIELAVDLSFVGAGLSLLYWSSLDFGEAKHKFRLAEQVLQEAASLRSAVSNILLQALNPHNPANLRLQ
jgi:hypothetical protein